MSSLGGTLPRPLLTDRDDPVLQHARLQPFLDQADDAWIADPMLDKADQSISDGTTVPVALRTGDVVSTILKAADEQKADLVAMPTSGHQGFLDGVRGSTTERVLRHAPCPVLAVPAGRPQADQRRAAGTDHRVAQALEILGLEAGATNEEIGVAYIHLMQRAHPDKGETDFFAKQLIDAREVLLGQRAR